MLDGFLTTCVLASLSDTLTDIDLFYLSILQTVCLSILSLVPRYKDLGLDLSSFLSLFV